MGGNRNALRMSFQPWETILNPKDDDKQDLAFTGYLKIGDVVDILDVDTDGNIIGSAPIYDNLIINAIVPNQFIVLNTQVNTTSFTGTPTLRVHNINNVQEAIDRLYRNSLSAPFNFNLVESIVAFELNKPSAGQGTYDVANPRFFKAGDKVDILTNEGLQVSNANILSVNVNADDTANKSTIVIDQSIDLTSLTNPIFVNKTITMQIAVERLQEDIDSIDWPIENEDANIINGEFEGTMTCFEIANLFLQNSTKPFIDGSRSKLGTAGSRATLSQGTTNSQLDFTSMILGTLGNQVKIQVVNAAGLAISITKTFSWTPGLLFSSSQYLIQINSNSGTATAKEIADAINADAEARRIVQVIYGGDGSGVVTPFGPTNLTNGLDDGTKDYAELEQVFENQIVATGRKFISFHIRPNDPLNNRMIEPPNQDEDMIVDYRRMLVNK